MIDLHHCVSARSFRPLWLLEELGIPYRLHMPPFPPRVHARDYLARNPLGTVPLLEDGGIEAFLQREVLPYTPDAWVDEEKTQIGYEVSFTRHFYKPQRLRTLEEIAADIVATEKEAEGLLEGLVKRGAA